MGEIIQFCRKSFKIIALYIYTIPAPWKKHGFLNEHGTRKEYIPAGADIIRTEKKKTKKTEIR